MSTGYVSTNDAERLADPTCAWCSGLGWKRTGPKGHGQRHLFLHSVNGAATGVPTDQFCPICVSPQLYEGSTQ